MNTHTTTPDTHASATGATTTTTCSAAKPSIGQKIKGAIQVVHGIGESIRGTALGAVDTVSHSKVNKGDAVAECGRQETAEGMVKIKGTSAGAIGTSGLRHNTGVDHTTGFGHDNTLANNNNGLGHDNHSGIHNTSAGLVHDNTLNYNNGLGHDNHSSAIHNNQHDASVGHHIPGAGTAGTGQIPAYQAELARQKDGSHTGVQHPVQVGHHIPGAGTVGTGQIPAYQAELARQKEGSHTGVQHPVQVGHHIPGAGTSGTGRMYEYEAGLAGSRGTGTASGAVDYQRDTAARDQTQTGQLSSANPSSHLGHNPTHESNSTSRWGSNNASSVPSNAPAYESNADIVGQESHQPLPQTGQSSHLDNSSNGVPTHGSAPAYGQEAQYGKDASRGQVL